MTAKSLRFQLDSGKNQEIDSEDTMLTLVQKVTTQITKVITVKERGVDIILRVSRVGIGPIKTKQGHFIVYYFRVNDEYQEYFAVVKAKSFDSELKPQFSPNAIPLRIDSGCFTGQFLGDTTCECREQFEKAKEIILQTGEGIILNIPSQDARGHGISFKLATLGLQQEFGIDTVEAALKTLQAAHRSEGKDQIDIRSYSGAIAILKFLGILSGAHIRVMTNNPKKIKELEDNKLIITERISIVIPETEDTAPHLAAKKTKLGHLL